MSDSKHALVPYWDREGVMVRLEGVPESIEGWVQADLHVDSHQGNVLSIVESCLDQTIVAIRTRAVGLNTILDARLSDGAQVILRVSRPFKDDRDKERKMQRSTGEIGIMRFLRRVSTIPVPDIYAVHSASEAEPFNFIVMQLMPGTTLMNGFGLLHTDAKERCILSYADICLQLFDIEVPQVIGGTLSVDDGNSLTALPIIHVQATVVCHEIFSSLEEYTTFLFKSKRQWLDLQALSIDERARQDSLLSLLEAQAVSIMQSTSSPSLRRCVLCHDDLNEQNILIHPDGNISAVIDWEYHSIKPVILAVSSPPWLKYDGTLSPYTTNGQTFWLESPAESARLNALFEEYVKSRNVQYFEALTAGRKLREIVEWVNDCEQRAMERLELWLDYTEGAQD
ncbi:hypothetical protein BDZ89DRAFT_238779 [Hymenopellis radicata]|nr:hypothetical protein BDZ89DRAFT_238779 [Hymenopellis radicata]